MGLVAESLQYIHLVDLLGLEKNSTLYIVIGNTFDFLDLLMYLIGGVLAASLDAWLMADRAAHENSPKAGGVGVLVVLSLSALFALPASAHPYGHLHDAPVPIPLSFIDEESRPIAGAYAAFAVYEVTGRIFKLDAPHALVAEDVLRADTNGRVIVPARRLVRATSHVEVLAWAPGREPVVVTQVLAPKQRVFRLVDTTVELPRRFWISRARWPPFPFAFWRRNCRIEDQGPVVLAEGASVSITLRPDTGLAFAVSFKPLTSLVAAKAFEDGIEAVELTAHRAIEGSIGAETRLRESLGREPDNGLLHYAMGILMLPRRTDTAATTAVRHLTLALEKDPSLWPA
jgi:hypothetical protein